jgi:hypothetical protein
MAAISQAKSPESCRWEKRMYTRPKLRVVIVFCVLVLVVSLASVVIAQTLQEGKKSLVRASTQSQISYQKMVQSETCTEQMARNAYTYQTKHQNKTSNRKMTQSNNSGSSGNRGQQGSSSGNNGGGNG